MKFLEDIFYSLTQCNFTLHDIKKELNRLKYLFKKRKLEAEDMIDFGCGDGTNTIKIAALLNAREVYGIDTNNQLLSQANKRHIRTIEHDITKPIRLKKRFQLALSYGVLHHLKNIKAAIKQMVRSTKKYILVIDLCRKKNSIKHDIGAALFPFELGENISTPEALLNALRLNNVKLLDYRIYNDVHPIFDRIVILGRIKRGD